MKRYNIGYYIKESVGSIFSHGLMSFASVFVIIACLLIMGSFFLLAFNVNAIIDKFEKENVILAYVNENASLEDARALESRIEALGNVEYASFISRDEAMMRLSGRYQDQSMFEDLDPTVLRHRYAVYLRDISLTEQTTNELQHIAGIASVNVNLNIAKGFVTTRNVVSGISLVIVAILIIVSLFIMANTIKLATFDRREEIAIMKIVGATNSFIRWPFVFQGFILGMMGAMAAFIAQWGIYTAVTKMLFQNYTMSFITTVPFSAVALSLLAIFVGIGFGVGVGGSAVAIRNYLRV